MYKFTKILLYIVFYYIVAIPYVIAQKDYSRSVISITVSPYMATAFYIGEGKFVTNFHVLVNKILLLNKLSLKVLSNDYVIVKDRHVNIKKIIHLDAINDLAVVQVDLKQIPILEQYITPLKVAKNTTLNKKSDYKIISIDYKNKTKPIHQELNIKSNEIKKNNEFIEIDTYLIQSGMSGSPLLVKNKVHGIVKSVITMDGKSTGFIIDASYLEVLLKKTPLNCSNYLCIKREIQILKNKSKNNDPKAQYTLGRLYSQLPEISNYKKKAIYQFKQAGQQNHAEALFNLGIIYWKNKLIKESIDYFEQAAQQNHTQAQIWLAKTYLDNQNLQKARYYLKQVAQQNDVKAKVDLGHISREKKELKTVRLGFQKGTSTTLKNKNTATHLEDCSKAFLK